MQIRMQRSFKELKSEIKSAAAADGDGQNLQVRK